VVLKDIGRRQGCLRTKAGRWQLPTIAENVGLIVRPFLLALVIITIWLCLVHEKHLKGVLRIVAHSETMLNMERDYGQFGY